MAIEAPLSKYKRTNYIIYFAVCLILAAWFGYDGFLNKGFIDRHTDEQGQADFDLGFNRAAPPFLVVGAVLIAITFYTVKDRKLIAGDTELLMPGKKRISYDAIDSIDKTYFKDKGYFTIVYRNNGDKEVQCKLNERQYDNLGAVLDLLVAKIS